MNTRDRHRMICRAGSAVLAALAIVMTGAVQPAVAQDLFQALFGGGGGPGYIRPEAMPPRVSSYADPTALFGRESRENRRHIGDSSGPTSGSSGSGTAYCVRTCDGRYFPLQRQAGISPAELCRSFCPASKTIVFSGSKIDYAVAHNGTRYADLDNAFAYRDKVSENCTCNGKDGLGLAQLSAVSDPTLRPGDIVATNDGLVNFRGKSAKSAEFTPINPSSSAWAQKLSEIKVRPAPPVQQVAVAPPADKDITASIRKSKNNKNKKNRRAQASR